MKTRTKCDLCYNYSLERPIEIINDPLYKLIINYEEIQNILQRKIEIQNK